MLELVRFSVRSRLRSTLVWGVAFGLVSAMIVASYTAFDPAELKQMTSAFSSDLLKAFGMTGDSIAAPEGYLASQFLLLAPIALAFYPASGAARAIAGAEADHSLDVILGTPIPRWAVPVASFVSSAIGVCVIAAIYAAITLLTALVFGVDLSVGDVAVSAVGLLPITLLFAALAVLVSAAVRTPGLVTGITGAVLVVTYLLQALVLVQPSLDWLRWLTPFHYYGSPIEHGLDLSEQAALLGVAAAVLLASLPVFRRRDVFA